MNRQDYLNNLKVGDTVTVADKSFQECFQEEQIVKITPKRTIITTRHKQSDQKIMDEGFRFNPLGSTNGDYFIYKILDPNLLEHIKQKLKAYETRDQVAEICKKSPDLNLEQAEQLIEAYNAIITGTYKSY